MRYAVLAGIFSLGAMAQTSISLNFSGTAGTTTQSTANGTGTLAPYGTASVVVTINTQSTPTLDFTFTLPLGTIQAASTTLQEADGSNVITGQASISSGTGAFVNLTGSFNFTIDQEPDGSGSTVAFTLTGSGEVTGGPVVTTIPAACTSDGSTPAPQGCAVIACDGVGGTLPIRNRPLNNSAPAGPTCSLVNIVDSDGSGGTLPILVFDGSGGTLPLLVLEIPGDGAGSSLPILVWEAPETGSGSTLPILVFDGAGSSLPIFHAPRLPNAATPRLSSSTTAPAISIFTAIQSTAASFSAVATCPGASTCWLTLPVTSGSIAANSSVGITALLNIQGLSPGSYSANVAITITPQNGTPATTNVPINIRVTSQPPNLGTGLQFQAVAGVTESLAQSLWIASFGPATPSFLASTSTLAAQNWLTVSPLSGTASASAPARLTVNASNAGLAAGTYAGEVSIGGNGPGAMPQSVGVALTVLPSTAHPGPVVSPTALVFVASSGNPAPQTVQVANISNQPLTLTTQLAFSNGNGWFSATASTGMVTATQPVTETISINANGLLPGIYVGTLDIHAAETNSDVPVEVLLVIPGASCTPKQLLPVFTNLEGGFQRVAGLPVGLEAQVVDNCGTPLNSGAATVYFSGSNVPASLIAVGNGHWAGSWQPDAATTGPVSVGIVVSSDAGLFGSSGVMGTLTANPGLTMTGGGPIVSLTFNGLNNNPISCVQANLNAAAGSAPLVTAQYSFDGGATFFNLPVADLPAAIAVPGSGTTKVVARVTDAANLTASSTSTFTIASACTAQPPIQASPSPMSFRAVQGGTAPAAQPLNVTGSVVSFVSAASSAGWLGVTEPAGPTPQSVSVSVNPAGLAAGPYMGVITLTPLNGGTPLQVTVNLTIAPPCTFTLTPPSASPTATAGSASITVNASDASCAWTATANAPWLNITSGASGMGSGPVAYSVGANNSVSSRNGSLTVAGLTFPVNQSGATPSFSLGVNSASISAAAVTGLGIAVNATPPDAPWTAVSNAAWIAITAGATGTGNGTVQYSATANTSVSQRVGTVTVAGLTFTVTQAGAGATFTLSPSAASVAAILVTGTFTVTATPSDATWTATSNVSWISITSGASGTGNGTVGYSIAANPSVNQRVGMISVAGQNFTVTQAGVAATFTLMPVSAGVAAAGGTGTVGVTSSATDAVWTAASNALWITITSGATGTGNGSVGYSVAGNNSVNARSGTLTIAGQTFTIMQAAAGTTFTLGATSANATAAPSTGSVTVTATPADAVWNAVSNVAWVMITSGASGTGNGTVDYSVAANNTSAQRVGTLTIAGQTFTITQAPGVTLSAGLAFYPVAPCRIMDTRGATGTFGGPAIPAQGMRTVPIPQSACNIPTTALAYSLNVTVVPINTLTYLSIWPAGQSQPVVSTLNSFDGSIVANAAIVPAGTQGAVSVFASDATQAIIDINGYFAPASTANSMSFYSLTPCRVVDTRGAAGPLGGPMMSGGSARSFPVSSSSCGAPNTAQAYSLNITVVPRHSLGYLTSWPTGQTQPVVSTLNSPNGLIVANAAIVPAGTNGAIRIFVTDDTDVIIDINGYFAPPGSPAAQSLYTVTPCRVADTRGGSSLAGNGSKSFSIPAGPCSGIPNTAQAYSLNVTVVPSGPLGYLTAWPTGLVQPVVSTLNSPAGRVVANAAIVPAGTGGAVTVFVTNPTDLILDINAYFAP
ncbi:MAG TPA: BACON domain-containing carbohydrate-binding protein [Bryobacteraceae bacterium]|nr:BACON domain-containing carbohydrate-binding protein [Bryobacteraceae bacterium]